MKEPPLPDFSAHDLQGHVAQLFVYPVKSCAGVSLQEAELTATGLAHDRAWMVVDGQGVFRTQRELPRMALVRPELLADALALHAPGMAALRVPYSATSVTTTAVRVWNDTVPAWDMGEPAAQWFSAFLGQPCRLVRFVPTHRRLSSFQWTGGVEAPNQFADGYPVLIASQASLDGLNARLAAAGHAAVGMERFRPNVVIAGVGEHDEDRIDRLHIAVDGAEEGAVAELQPVKPCTRCPIPDIDPATAERGHAVGDTLRTYRQDARMGGGITFGMNAIVRAGQGARLRVGQAVGADLAFG